jgi:hypothetical protein
MTDKKKRSLGSKLAWLAIILVLLGSAAGGGVWYYGSTLPEKHMAAGVVEIAAPVKEVFALQADPRRGEEFRDDLSELLNYKSLGGGRASWTEVWTNGRSFDFEITEYRRNRTLTVTIRDHREMFHGSWRFQFEEVEGGTRVTLTEEGYIPNALNRGLFHVITSTDAMLNAHLKTLKAHFEKPEA